MWPAFWILIGPQCQLFQPNLQHNMCRIDIKRTLNLLYTNEQYPSHCITEQSSTYNTSYCTDTNTCLFIQQSMRTSRTTKILGTDHISFNTHKNSAHSYTTKYWQKTYLSFYTPHLWDSCTNTWAQTDLRDIVARKKLGEHLCICTIRTRTNLHGLKVVAVLPVTTSISVVTTVPHRFICPR